MLCFRYMPRNGHLGRQNDASIGVSSRKGVDTQGMFLSEYMLQMANKVGKELHDSLKATMDSVIRVPPETRKLLPDGEPTPLGELLVKGNEEPAAAARAEAYGLWEGLGWKGDPELAERTHNLIGEYFPRISMALPVERLQLWAELAVKMYDLHGSMRIKLVRYGHLEDANLFDDEHYWRCQLGVWHVLSRNSLDEAEIGAIHFALAGCRSRWLAKALTKARAKGSLTGTEEGEVGQQCHTKLQDSDCSSVPLQSEEPLKSFPSAMLGVGDANLIAQRRALLDEYRTFVPEVSHKKIYESRNSQIHKPEFYEWLSGQLPSSSQTCVNFERFLREKKPPLPKN